MACLAQKTEIEGGYDYFLQMYFWFNVVGEELLGLKKQHWHKIRGTGYEQMSMGN